MPTKGYVQTNEHKEKCRQKKMGKNNPMHGKKAKHKPDCPCSFCKAERGELSGKNNHMFGKGHLISGNKNGNFKEKIPFTCQQCSKIKYVLPAYAKTAKYCSNKCKFAAGLSKETKENIRIAMNTPDIRKRHMKGLLKNLRFKDTSIEIKMQNILKENNIKFETQKLITGTPDIFIEPNICIFCDGDYWHTRPNSKTRDEYVNQTLKKQGYKVLRFWEHSINKNTNVCFHQIQQSNV